jgi:hypothetical protein
MFDFPLERVLVSFAIDLQSTHLADAWLLLFAV